MYKLFLCLRYLRLKFIAYLPMVAVALCVAMMLIVISVMNGFLHKIEIAARGLYGDIVIDTSSLSGMTYYDEFSAYIKEKLPQMRLNGVRPLKAEEIKASPFIYSGGILDYDDGQNRIRQMVQVAGIRLPERTEVSSFGQGLCFEKGLAKPSFDPPADYVRGKIDEVTNDLRQIYLDEKSSGPDKAVDSNKKRYILSYLDFAIRNLDECSGKLEAAKGDVAMMSDLQRQIDQAKARPPGSKEAQKIPELEEKLNKLADGCRIQPPTHRVILGLGIPGLSVRTDKGKTIRMIGPGQNITLTLLPLGRPSLSMMDIKPQREVFTVADDCRTDVSPVDSNTVYLPFETLQLINQMEPKYAADDPARLVLPGRCSQVHVKLWKATPSGLVQDDLDETQLATIAKAIEGLWDDFSVTHPDPSGSRSRVYVETWRQRQVALVSQIASQRTLVVIMFGIISMVSVVLIFVIFYNIVYQKTKDIGVMKSLGASSSGVGAIFLSYGAAVGLIGSVFGVIGGYYFVKNINPIHDWIGRTFGLVIWNREWFMFEKIPSEVEPRMTVFIVICAIMAGLVGALLPALLAARKQPVEALRYE